MNNNWLRHKWVRKNTNTITFTQAFDSFEDWAELVGLESTDTHYDDYKKIFNTIFVLYGDSYLHWNTTDYAAPWVMYIMQEEYEKYLKINEIYQKEIDDLNGLHSESNVFNIGDIKEYGSDYDKFKTGRQTLDNNMSYLDTMERLLSRMTPFTSLIDSIATRLFKHWNQDIEFVEVK